MSDMTNTLAALRVLPVLTVADVDEALALCGALQRGGIGAVEITLRTPAALAAITAVKRAYPQLRVAAGTVNSVSAMEAVAAAGAGFALSPGMTPALIRSAQALGLPFVPGVATASEVLQGMEFGLDCFKLFPSAAIGGPALLKALAEPLAGVSFCPTGGINQDNFTDYLAQPNVVCVGGGWLAPANLVAQRAWDAIAERAAATLAKLPAVS